MPRLRTRTERRARDLDFLAIFELMTGYAGNWGEQFRSDRERRDGYLNNLERVHYRGRFGAAFFLYHDAAPPELRPSSWSKLRTDGLHEARVRWWEANGAKALAAA